MQIKWLNQKLFLLLLLLLLHPVRINWILTYSRDDGDGIEKRTAKGPLAFAIAGLFAVISVQFGGRHDVIFKFCLTHTKKNNSKVERLLTDEGNQIRESRAIHNRSASWRFMTFKRKHLSVTLSCHDDLFPLHSTTGRTTRLFALRSLLSSTSVRFALKNGGAFPADAHGCTSELGRPRPQPHVWHNLWIYSSDLRLVSYPALNRLRNVSQRKSSDYGACDPLNVTTPSDKMISVLESWKRPERPLAEGHKSRHSAHVGVLTETTTAAAEARPMLKLAFVFCLFF